MQPSPTRPRRSLPSFFFQRKTGSYGFGLTTITSTRWRWKTVSLCRVWTAVMTHSARLKSFSCSIHTRAISKRIFDMKITPEKRLLRTQIHFSTRVFFSALITLPRFFTCLWRHHHKVEIRNVPLLFWWHYFRLKFIQRSHRPCRWHSK